MYDPTESLQKSCIIVAVIFVINEWESDAQKQKKSAGQYETGFWIAFSWGSKYGMVPLHNTTY